MGRDLFDDDHEAFRDSVRKYLAASAADAGGIGGVRSALASAGAAGFLGVTVPEEFDGGGVDDPRFAVVLGEAAMMAGHTALALRAGLQAWVAIPALMRHATAEQQRAWLPGLATGERCAAVAGLGADGPFAAERTAEGIVVSGRAAAVTGAAEADLLLVVAMDADRAPVLAVIETAVGSEPIPRTAVERPLGSPGSAAADLEFDRVVVPVSAVLPAADAASARTQCAHLRADLDLWLAVLAVAGARAALGETVGYVRERTVFERPLAEFENTCAALGRVAVDLGLAETFVDAAVRARAAGPVAPDRAARAVTAATELYSRAGDEGLQLHGGYGYMREYPIAAAFADARHLLLEADRWVPALDLVAAAVGLQPPGPGDDR